MKNSIFINKGRDPSLPSVTQDDKEGRYSLVFIENKEQEEVDFLIADRRKPLLLVEAKQSDSQPSSALKKFQETLKVRRSNWFRSWRATG